MPQYTQIWWACGDFITIINKLSATVKRHNTIDKNDIRNQNNT